MSIAVQIKMFFVKIENIEYFNLIDDRLQGIGDLCYWYGGRTCTAKFNPTSGNPATHAPVHL